MKLTKPLPFLLALVAAGCGEPRLEDPTAIETRSHELWLGPGAVVWPRSGSGPANIPVCFNGNDFSGAGTREQIRFRVEDAWERYAHLDFQGWGTCPTPAPTSNIVIVKHTPGLTVAGQTNWLGKAPSGPNIVEYALAAPDLKTTVHEFGHVLGFNEENTSAPCATQTAGTSLEGQSDLADSVMTQTGCGSAAELSAWDIMGVRKAYGLKPPRTIAGTAGLALRVLGNSSAPGAAIVGGPAQGAGNDKWVPLPSMQLRASPGGVYTCLAVKGGAVGATLTLLESSPCASAPAQIFHSTAVQWRAMGKMCVAANSVSVGAGLSIQSCSDVPAQRWDFNEGSASIRLSGTGLCVEVPGGSTALGTLIKLATCNPNASEQLLFRAAGRIPWGDKCFNVFGNVATPGKALGLWDGCTADPPTSNSVFTFAGKLTGMGGQCVTMTTAPVDGVPIGIATCQSPRTSQTWETYW